jgi:hypothetical protein
MSILYLCSNCCKVVGIKSNHLAENKVGRKYCSGCGDNTEWWLHCMAEDKVIKLIDDANKALKENPKVASI